MLNNIQSGEKGEVGKKHHDAERVDKGQCYVIQTEQNRTVLNHKSRQSVQHWMNEIIFLFFSLLLLLLCAKKTKVFSGIGMKGRKKNSSEQNENRQTDQGEMSLV